MEKTYEGKITGEIRRTLRNLEEACAEQQITMEEALEWYVTNKAKIAVASEEPVSTNQELSYRERAELFVSKYVEDEEQKAICVIVLCYLSQHEKCPVLELILNELNSKIRIVQTRESELKEKMGKALTKLIDGYQGRAKEYKYRAYPGYRNMQDLKKIMFVISKTL